MQKNTVQINESQLKKIVAESIKNVLSEIDWKTYANAAKKSHDKAKNATDDKEAKKYKDKRDKFNQAATDSFNKDYGKLGLGKNIDNPWVYGMEGLNDDASGLKFGYGATTRLYGLKPSSSTSKFNIHEPGKFHPNISAGITPDSYTEHFDSDNLIDPAGVDASEKGNAEVKNYMRDKYEYQKGKGWKLKDKK